MKAYTLDLRKRIVDFVKAGGSKGEAGNRFKVARKTVYRYLEADAAGSLAPKQSWGGWRKLDPARVAREVKRRPDATLAELAQALGVWHTTVRYRLGRLKVTLKKNRALPRAGRGAEVALPQGDRAARRTPGVLPGRERG
jgi:transposase